MEVYGQRSGGLQIRWMEGGVIGSRVGRQDELGSLEEGAQEGY